MAKLITPEQLTSTEQKPSSVESILIFGPSGTGKTVEAATIAHYEPIKRIIYLDGEKSTDSINPPPKGLLTPEQTAKFDIYHLRDILGNEAKAAGSDVYSIPAIKSEPRFAQSVLNFLGATSREVYYHPVTATILTDKKPGCESLPSWLGMGPGDALVIDTLSQLAVSLHALVQLKYRHAHGMQDWGVVAQLLNTILSRFQNPHTSVVCVTHIIEQEKIGVREGMVYPLVGSKNYSVNAAKYFGHTVLANPNDNRFRFYTTLKNPAGAYARSRRHVDLSKQSNPSLATLFIGGITNYENATKVSKFTIETDATKAVAEATNE